MSDRPALRRLAWALMIGVALVITIVPIYWMIATSLKTNKEITLDGTLVPRAPTFDNYRRLFAERNFGAFLRNSVIVTSVSTAIALAMGSLAAYSLARFRLRFNLQRRFGAMLLMARIVPPPVIVVPIYLMMLKLGLMNTWLGLIIVYTAFNVSLVVWMMESFFREIPVDLEEAAMVDGDSRLSAFLRVVVPLAAPGLAATGIFAAIATFNEFLFALVLTATPASMTLPRGTATLIGRIDIDWGAMAAAGVIGALPIVVFALLVQRHLVRGLTFGAVK